MKKNILNISELERLYILDLHESHRKNSGTSILKEQYVEKESDIDIKELTTRDRMFLVNQQKFQTEKQQLSSVAKLEKPVNIEGVFLYPMNDLNIAFSIYGLLMLRRNLPYDASGKPSKTNKVVGFQVANSKSYPTETKEFQSVLSKMDEVSKSTFESAKTLNPLFYAYVAANSYKILQSLGKTKEQKVTVESKKTMKETQSVVTVTPIIFDDKKFPIESKFNSGSPTLLDNFKTNFVSSFTSAANKALEEIRKKNTVPGVTYTGKFYIKDIIITASSSRVPQTKLPPPYNDPKTGFLALTEARGNAMLTMVNDMIKNSNGVYFVDGNTKTTMDVKGKNGDGTSGPEWKKDDPANYKQWQSADVKIIYAVQPSVIPPKPELVTETDFVLDATGVGRKRLVIPVPEINLGGIFGGGFNFSFGGGSGIPCPTF